MDTRISTSTRRRLLRGLAALPAIALPASILARSKSFDATEMNEAMTLLTEGQTPTEHVAIELEVPDVAEDSSKVPVQVYAPLPGIQKISILVEDNPMPLISVAHIGKFAEPFVSLRVKMRTSTRVIALAHTSEGLFQASREVTVAAGGCG